MSYRCRPVALAPWLQAKLSVVTTQGPQLGMQARGPYRHLGPVVCQSFTHPCQLSNQATAATMHKGIQLWLLAPHHPLPPTLNSGWKAKRRRLAVSSWSACS